MKRFAQYLRLGELLAYTAKAISLIDWWNNLNKLRPTAIFQRDIINQRIKRTKLGKWILAMKIIHVVYCIRYRAITTI